MLITEPAAIEACIDETPLVGTVVWDGDGVPLLFDVFDPELEPVPVDTAEVVRVLPVFCAEMEAEFMLYEDPMMVVD